MSSAYPTGKNPFFTDDDDCVGFGSSGSKPRGFRDVSDDEFARPVPTKAQQLQTLKEESMSRQLESTQRALSSIYDSERMGVATAEELLHQGEQLDNIEAKTDSINEDMKVSQRHLNSIKSVFGGIKNWWSGGEKKDQKEPAAPKTHERQSRLRDNLDTERQNESAHPALRLRAGDVSGFYADDSGPSQGAQQQEQRQVGGARAAYDQQYNQNLDMMSDGMSRLKNLALGLGDEIETQNEQLDRINTKVDRADISIMDKNRQMRQILGVKK